MLNEPERKTTETCIGVTQQDDIKTFYQSPGYSIVDTVKKYCTDHSIDFDTFVYRVNH